MILTLAVLAFELPILLGLQAAEPANAATTSIVNSTGDGGDNNPGNGTCATAPFPVGTEPECTLRAAIQETNANVNGATVVDEIDFFICGCGAVQTISPASPLPAITEPVVVDGYSEPGASANTRAVGNNAVLLIELNGTNVSTDSGLNIAADDSGIRGLMINRFYSGVVIEGREVEGATVEGNFIGTNAARTPNLGNGAGVTISRGFNHTIGGTEVGARNVISGNTRSGVGIYAGATDNKVQGNYIGTDAAGSAALGNGGSGVEVVGAVINPAIANRVLSNSIFANTGLGIDLGGDGVTPNDGPGDADTGDNNLQNYPVITSAASGRRGTIIKGKLESTQNATFAIQFFSNPTSTNDEGKKLLGEKFVTDTDGDGIVSFNFKPARKVKGGMFVTATATNHSTGDTSEFSAPRRVREA